jgi:general stress protein YciG
MGNTSNRGFASMDNAKQREIASKGGRAAHIKGTAHEWSVDEARAAGRKGGEMRGSRIPVSASSKDVAEGFAPTSKLSIGSARDSGDILRSGTAILEAGSQPVDGKVTGGNAGGGQSGS